MAKEVRKVHISVSSNASKELNKGTKSATGLSGALKGVGASANIATGGIRAMGAALMSSGIGLVVVALGSLAAGFGSVISKSSEFEKALSTLEAVTGSSKAEISSLSDLAKELGSTTQFTASQVVSLQTELAKLGFKTDDIKNATGDILDLAASLDVGLGEAAEFSGSLIRSFGLSTEETARVVDVMAKSTSSSALNFESLRESLKLVAPVSKATGVSIEETTGLLAVLADRGLKGSIAGTGLAKTFIELNKKGITLEEGMRRVKESADPLNTAIDMVGVVAGKTFLTLASGSEDIDGMTQSLIASKGAAQEQAEVRFDNLIGDTKKLSSAWEGLLLSIEDGTGIISRIARGFVQLATSVTSFLTPQKDATQGIKDQQLELFKLESQLLNTNTSEEQRRDIIIKLKKEYPDYLAHLDTEKATNEELSKAISKVNDNLVNKILLGRKEQELLEQGEKVADKFTSKSKARGVLEDRMAKLRAKHDLDATEGTLEQQAAALRQLILDKGTLVSLQDRDDATKLLRNGVTLLQKAQEGLNKEQGKQTEILSEQDALYKELGITRVKTEEETTDKVVAVGKGGNKTLTEDQQAELEKRKQNRIDFLAKLKTIEENAQDTTEQAKIQRRRERHLERVTQTITDETELEEVKKRVNDHYDTLKDNQDKLDAKTKADKLKEFLGNFDIEGDDPMAKLDSAQELHLKELEQLKLNTTEKAEAVKKIEDFYNGQRDILKETKRVTDDEQDARDLEAKRAMLSQGLDLAIEASGEESKIGKALLKVKTAFMLAEMAMKMKTMILNLKSEAKAGVVGTKIKAAGQSASIGEGYANSAKLGFPFNVLPLAMMAAQSVMMIQGMNKSKKEMQQATSGLGIGGIGGGGGATAVQAPAFNVIGQGSTDANLIADTIEGTNQRPVRAFVVDKDITSAQELSRNTEGEASVG